LPSLLLPPPVLRILIDKFARELFVIICSVRCQDF
jgi:hypothetical protein